MNTDATTAPEPGEKWVPVLWNVGQEMKLLRHEDLQTLQRRWAEALRGRAEDPLVKAILGMAGHRISQATAAVQDERAHCQGAGGPGLVSYRAGMAAALNDFVLDLVRATQGQTGER